MATQRPLTAEPLALDLVNTEWLEGGQRHDLLSTPQGTQVWVQEVGFERHLEHYGDLQELQVAELRATLQEVRAALRRALEAGETGPLNEVLRKGVIREQLSAAGPVTTYEVPESSRVAWLVAHSYLELLRDAPERIRACGQENCMLWFYDTSKSGRRRWCTMQTCGNRAKARRYQQRHRGDNA